MWLCKIFGISSFIAFYHGVVLSHTRPWWTDDHIDGKETAKGSHYRVPPNVTPIKVKLSNKQSALKFKCKHLEQFRLYH